jgi:hypothetical protein
VHAGRNGIWLYGYQINAFEALSEPREAQKVMTVSFASGDDLYEGQSACLACNET